jgi:SAM-dependent methyltransferase
LALGAGVVVSLRGAPARRWMITLAIGAACVAPFVVLQAACNKGITGYWTHLPWSHYAERNGPHDSPSLAAYDPARRSRSAVPQIRAFEESVTAEAYRAKLEAGARGRIFRIVRSIEGAGLPHPLMLVLIPAAVLALPARARWVMAVFLVGFVVAYAPYTFVIGHYATTVAPALVLLVLAGWDALALAAGRAAGAVRVVGAAGLLGLTLCSLPQFLRLPEEDEWPTARAMRDVDARVAAATGGRPAIVLFRFDPEHCVSDAEPVYNADASWPDDATVIRAHDLGERRNRELFAYYARVSPGRAVYRFDRAEREGTPVVTYLGVVRDLAGTKSMSTIDFARAAVDYGAYRPPFDSRLFERLAAFGIGVDRQLILDVGAGTGLLGRGFAGARVVECDVGWELIRQAGGWGRVVARAEALPFGDETFDAVTAGQSWHWFDRRVAPREIRRVLKPGGRVAVVYQTYLPVEGNVAEASERVILKYRPGWRHAGGVGVNGQALKDLQVAGFLGIESFTFDVDVPFTREAWRGFVRTCSAVGPAMSAGVVEVFDREHMTMLEGWPETLVVPHRVFAAVAWRR